jgi:hypothetical protein
MFSCHCQTRIFNEIFYGSGILNRQMDFKHYTLMVLFTVVQLFFGNHQNEGI